MADGDVACLAVLQIGDSVVPVAGRVLVAAVGAGQEPGGAGQLEDDLEQAAAVGRAGAAVDEEQGRTAWIPRAEVHRVEARSISGVEVRMDALAALATPDAVRTALAGLPDQYAAWIADQRRIPVDSDARRETADLLMNDADLARGRVAAGIELLATDATVLDAFRTANAAMAEAARRRSPDRYTDQKVPSGARSSSRWCCCR